MYFFILTLKVGEKKVLEVSYLPVTVVFSPHTSGREGRRGEGEHTHVRD